MGRKRVRITPGLKEALAWLTLSKPALIERVRLELANNPGLEEEWCLPFPSSVPGETDLIVEPIAGGLRVRLVDEGVPRLGLCRSGRDGVSPEAALRVLRRARWVLAMLRRRGEILEKVGQAVAEAQQAYLTGQAERPLPLTLTAVARRVGLHPSTVSRVTREKLLLAPRGVVELRRLFGTPAAEAREAIRELLASEPTRGIINDTRIVELLAARGLRISRRTVSKYRQALGVPGARWRGRRQR